MKKIMCIALTAMMVIMAGSSAGYAFRAGGGHGGHGGRGGHGWHGGHGGYRWHGGYGRSGVWIGPGWGWPYYPYYPYYSYPYYSAPPVVIEEQPDTYIQQAPPAEGPTYWYFCREPAGYYPYVKKCAKGWLKVVPPSTPEDKEE